MRWLAACAALGILFTCVRSGEAQERDTGGHERSSHAVTITIAGDPDTRATEATLRDLFAQLTEARAVTLEVGVTSAIDPRSITGPPPAPTPAFARVWIDVRSDTCLVSIADEAWERIYQRRMPRPPGNDDVTREQIAQIVFSAIEAMLAGGKIGVARASLLPPPQAAPPAAATPVREAPARIVEERPRPGATLGVGYEALMFSSRAIAHGPIASLHGAVEDGPWSLGVGLTAQWRAPITVERIPIGVRLDTKSFRVVLDGTRALGPQMKLRAGIAPGLDVTSIEPRGVSRAGEGEQPTITVEASRTRVSPVLRWSVAIDVRLVPGMEVTLAGVLDHALTNRSYVVRYQGIERDVLAPFALRPGLTLSIAADLVRAQGTSTSK